MFYYLFMDLTVSNILYKKKYFWFKALANSCNNLASTLFAIVLVSPGLVIYFKPFSLQNIIALLESIIIGLLFFVLSVYFDRK